MLNLIPKHVNYLEMDKWLTHSLEGKRQHTEESFLQGDDLKSLKIFVNMDLTGQSHTADVALVQFPSPSLSAPENGIMSNLMEQQCPDFAAAFGSLSDLLTRF